MVILHALKRVFKREQSIAQKKTETSLIGLFMYPKYGPGQLWETVANLIEKRGGRIYLNQEVIKLHYQGNLVTAVTVLDHQSGRVKTVEGDYFFSSMPVKDLIKAMGDDVSQAVKTTAQGLIYRDFLTVGLLVKKLKVKNTTKIKTVNNLIPDNWIYIQDKRVRMGRLQIFNNWSPYLVSSDKNVWIGLEYFCNEGDYLWNMDDEKLKKFAVEELVKIGLIESDSVLDRVIIRLPKTYPAYFGTYKDFQIIRDFTDQFKNLFLIGRNGTHRYNNMDHSMLTAMTAVDNIIKGIASKENIWKINAEEEYLEEKKADREY